jgi:hypothetical protein
MADDPSAEIIRLFSSSRSGQVSEGLRLVRAFMKIQDPVLRDALLAFAERIAKPRAAKLQRTGRK